MPCGLAKLLQTVALAVADAVGAAAAAAQEESVAVEAVQSATAE